jgi:hypothetical protein
MVLLSLLAELSALQAQTDSPRGIARARQQWLQNEGDGLPVYLYELLSASLDAFFQCANNNNNNTTCVVVAEQQPSSWTTHPATVALRTCLDIYRSCAQADTTFATELGAQGTHILLSRLLQWQPANDNDATTEDNADCLVELQDLAGAIAAGRPFPMKRSPFSRDALVERLPLAFTIRPAAPPSTTNEAELVWIHQVTHRQSAQEDVGFGKFVFVKQTVSLEPLSSSSARLCFLSL